MLTQLMEKLKLALRDAECSYCRHRKAPHGLLCEGCEEKLGLRQDVPLFALSPFPIYSATLFNPRIKRLIYPYKFYQRHDYAPVLSDILIHYWQKADKVRDSKHTWVVPIPGRNGDAHPHVAAFAQRFASDFGYNFRGDLLTWTRETEHQHTLTTKRRRLENISGSLAISDPAWQQGKVKNILIVDDITTTGATLQEARRAICQPGHESDAFEGSVCGLTLCHIALSLHSQIS